MSRVMISRSSVLDFVKAENDDIILSLAICVSCVWEDL